MRAWIVPSMFAFVFWGLWGFFPKITTRYMSPNSVIFYEALMGLPIALVILGLLRFQVESDPRGIVLASITGVLGTLGAFGFLIAVTRGPVSLITAFTALYPVLTIVLAMLFLGETLEPRQWVGVVTALFSIVLIAV